jgi:TfoX/Sxy family transcriptional regulator of competence genes
VAYDEDLANRIREQLAGESGITEKAMFGGLAFLLGGNMAVSASGQGGLIVRIDPEQSDDALADPHAKLMEMRGRRMPGWIRVATDGVESDQQLARWVRRGVKFARTLPAKG